MSRTRVEDVQQTEAKPRGGYEQWIDDENQTIVSAASRAQPAAGISHTWAEIKNCSSFLKTSGPYRNTAPSWLSGEMWAAARRLLARPAEPAGCWSLSRSRYWDSPDGPEGWRSSSGTEPESKLLASLSPDPPPSRFDVLLAARLRRLAARAFSRLQLSLGTGAGVARRLNGRQ